MKLINDHIKWIMIVTGAITCSMLFAAINPEAALMSTFGETVSGPVAEIVVRNWGALIALVGAMLIVGGIYPQYRIFVLVVACISKSIFIGLVLTFGMQFIGTAGAAVLFDAVVVLLFITYMVTQPKATTTANHPGTDPH